MPSVMARLPPTSKALFFTWLGMPPLLIRSCSKLETPSSALLPPVSKKRRRASGLAMPLVGARASVTRPTTNWPRLVSSSERLLVLSQSFISLLQAR
ncbi:hypothetical protein D3C80_1151310 [compost metagenome]